MGTRQFYQRPPNSDVTDEQKAKIKQALEQSSRWMSGAAGRGISAEDGTLGGKIQRMEDSDFVGCRPRGDPQVLRRKPAPRIPSGRLTPADQAGHATGRWTKSTPRTSTTEIGVAHQTDNFGTGRNTN